MNTLCYSVHLESLMNMVKKYIGEEKSRTFKSFKNFYKKYEGYFYVIGNGTFDNPEYYIGLQVENPHYVGQPYKVRLYFDKI